jgi:hypothetical protein
MSAKILVFPKKHNWVFVLRAPSITQGGVTIVLFTVVPAPPWKEDDEACLAPLRACGWHPLIHSTDGLNRPIATEWKGRPIDSFNHAVNEFLRQEERLEIREERTQLTYVAPYEELRRSS